MKVALTYPGVHRRGGVERVVFEIARFLASRAHTVEVFANEWEEDSSASIRYHHVPVQTRPGFLRPVSYRRACSEALKAVKYDVLSTHGCECPFEGVFWAHSVHRAWLDHSSRLRSPFSPARIKQRLNPIHPILLRMEAEHFRKRRYRKVIALTADVQADLFRFYGVPDTDVVVIPDGYSPEEFSYPTAVGRREEMRSQLGYRAEDRVVVFVANELERKGFGPLLRAIASLKEDRVKLLAVGRLDPQAYAGEIAQLGMQGRVKFTGPTREVARYYAASDLFALPTQYEAWGLVIVEAMACGLPVVTSRLAGAAITVCEGRNGSLLDNPRDPAEIAAHLKPLVERGGLREEIAGSVADYTWEKILLQFEGVLLETLG